MRKQGGVQKHTALAVQANSAAAPTRGPVVVHALASRANLALAAGRGVVGDAPELREILVAPQACATRGRAACR